MANLSLSRAATLALAFALAGGAAWAASGRVGGQVTGPDGRPIEGVEVASGTAQASTDVGGLYANDRCPVSDQRPTVTIDGCDTGLGNGILKGCTAMDVLLDCSERTCRWYSAHWRGHRCKPWHLLGCLAEPRFLRRVDGLTWRTWSRAMACARRATLPLAELGQQPPAPASSATLHATLLPAVRARFDATADGRVEGDGFVVTFPAGSIAAEGEVEAGLAPLDVTIALTALPGGSRAVDTSLQETLIEPQGALHVTLTQGGLPVSLDGAGALPVQIEVPLAPDPRFEKDDRLALWFFDATDGRWKEQLGGAKVQESSILKGRLAAVAGVGRTGWWTVALAGDSACLTGTVDDAEGASFAGALVAATGLNPYALAGAQSGGGDGAYCIEAPLGSAVSVRASAVAGGLRLDSDLVESTMPLSAGRCAIGGCGEGPPLALPAVSCVCGTTYDKSGQPQSGVRIVTSAGSTAVGDSQGWFCLAAPARQHVTLFPEGYGPMDVLTGGPATAPNGCVVVEVVPASGP
jgi:hypothetical protein